MKILKILGAIVLIFILGFVALNIYAGKDYDVNRSVEINAPASYSYGLVNDLTEWESWSPWYAKDSAMVVTYSENTSGEGAWYTWDGPVANKGKLTILTSEKNKSMTSEIDFGEMGKSNGYWIFDEVDGKTTVTWGFKGEMPWFLSFMTLSMNDMVGQDFESGLNKIKALAEEMATSTPAINIELVTVEAMPYYSITSDLTFAEISNSETYANHFGELGAFLGENNSAALGNPFVIFHVWDEENKVAQAEFCFPNSADVEETERVKKGMSHGGDALKAVKTGDYNTKAEHEAMYLFAEESGLKIGDPWEIYADPDTHGMYVEVYYPIYE